MWNLFNNKSSAPPPSYGSPLNGRGPASPNFDAAPANAMSKATSNTMPADDSVPAPPTSQIATIEMMGSAAVATITVTELTQGDGAEQLAELLQVLKETGARHYALDIQNIQFMDSMCLGCLVESLNDMSAHGGKIALVNTAGSVQSLFRMTRLDRVFPICRDVMHAIEMFDRPAA